MAVRSYEPPSQESRQEDTLGYVKEAINDPNSCLTMVHKTVMIPLSPSAIGNEERAILSTLNHWLCKYVNELDGLLIAYDNVDFASEVGIIKDDLPYVFWDISADFYLFEPKVNSVLKGKVTRFGKASSKLVTCHIYGSFSATISVPDPIPQSLSPYLKTNQDIMFRVLKINAEKCNLHGAIDDDTIALTTQIPLSKGHAGAPINLADF